jgi:hypothetical protein
MVFVKQDVGSVCGNKLEQVGQMATEATEGRRLLESEMQASEDVACAHSKPKTCCEFSCRRVRTSCGGRRGRSRLRKNRL